MPSKEQRREYQKKYQKEYYSTHRDCIKKRHAEWNNNNKDARKRYRDNNQDHIKSYRREYYQEADIFKKEMVSYKGGKCFRCGYDKCMAALDFHHIDPSQKEFSLGPLIRALAVKTKNAKERILKKIQMEIDKCILLCANCHREEHFLKSSLNQKP